MRVETLTHKSCHSRKEIEGSSKEVKTTPTVLQSLWSPEHTVTFLPMFAAAVLSACASALSLSPPGSSHSFLKMQLTRKPSFPHPQGATFRCAGCTLYKDKGA